MYKIEENIYNLNENDWFVVGKRINKKRSFLFISKRLGKHLENNSSKILHGAMLLSRRLNEVFVKADDNFDWELGEEQFVNKYFNDFYNNKNKMVFIGFAETATGIGQSVFDRFDNSLYFHTTREDVEGEKSLLNFEEEHSHATSHRCYVEEGYLKNDYPVVLVDDEVSTGNTSLNIIKDIHSKFPRKEYVVVSILNWMNDDELEGYKKFEKENNVKIHLVYLFKGKIDRTYQENLGENKIFDTTIDVKNNVKVSILDNFIRVSDKYIKETGRFGMTSKEQHDWKIELKNIVKNEGKETLVIGNGELMYIPIVYSYLLGDKKVKTTTRSPIFANNEESNVIKTAYKFDSLDGDSVPYYIYNLSEKIYDKYVLMLEKNTKKDKVNEMISMLKSVVGDKEIEIVLV